MLISKSKLALALALSGALGMSLPAQAQTSSEQRQAALSKSVVFLEQIIGAWSLVLPKWDKDPAPEDWQNALQSCARTMDGKSAKVVGDADPTLPQTGLLVGDLVYYRGKDGLQQLSGIDKDLRKYPKLRLGQSQTGAIMYQISNSSGEDAVTISIGKIPIPSGSAIVMIREQALYLRCPPK